jgi:hypothetical protein
MSSKVFTPPQPSPCKGEGVRKKFDNDLDLLYQLSTVNCQLSTANYQLSTVNYQLSTVNCQQSFQLRKQRLGLRPPLGVFP